MNSVERWKIASTRVPSDNSATSGMSFEAVGPRRTSRTTAERIAAAEAQLDETLEDLRRLARGLHPRLLSEVGLEGALTALAEAFPIPIEIQFLSGRVRADAELVAYFVCSEALTNVAKHASASTASVCVTMSDRRVTVVVEDDGVGGANPAHGSGLRGLADRIETVGGTLHVRSEPGAGTRLTAEIPLGGEAAVTGAISAIFVQGFVVMRMTSPGIHLRLAGLQLEVAVIVPGEFPRRRGVRMFRPDERDPITVDLVRSTVTVLVDEGAVLKRHGDRGGVVGVVTRAGGDRLLLADREIGTRR